MSCTQEALGYIASETTFTGWKQITDTQLNSISTVIDNRPTAQQQQILLEQQKKIFDTLNCLQKKISEIQGTSTNSSTTQEQILNTRKLIQDEEENVAIARDRLNYLKNRASDVSYYESWFPLDRPLKKTTIPILLSFACFFTLLSIGYIFAALGLEILIKNTWQPYEYPEWARAIFGQLTITFWITLALLIAVVWYYESKKVAPTDSVSKKD